MRLLRANVIACCINASVAAGFDLDARSVSFLVCHRQFAIEDNSRDLVTAPRANFGQHNFPLHVPGKTHLRTEYRVAGFNVDVFALTTPGVR